MCQRLRRFGSWYCSHGVRVFNINPSYYGPSGLITGARSMSQYLDDGVTGAKAYSVGTPAAYWRLYNQ